MRQEAQGDLYTLCLLAHDLMSRYHLRGEFALFDAEGRCIDARKVGDGGVFEIKPKKRRCKQCKRVFQPESGNQKFCSRTCKTVYNQLHGIPDQNPNAGIIRNITDNIGYDAVKRQKEVEKRSKNRAEVNETARKLGMSYGQYMAMQYKKEHPWRKYPAVPGKRWEKQDEQKEI